MKMTTPDSGFLVYGLGVDRGRGDDCDLSRGSRHVLELNDGQVFVARMKGGGEFQPSAGPVANRDVRSPIDWRGGHR